MKKNIFIISVVLLLAAAVTIFADDLKGRDLVTKGTLKEMEGNFVMEDNEWYLLTGSERFLIHQGPDFYTDEIGINLKDNDQIKVYGYLYSDEITPVKITANNKDYLFRDNTGRPLWAGRGQGRNRR